MADVSAGETFATGQTVTDVRLNNHVNGLTILPSFVSAKPSITPVGTDRLLSYQISGSLLNAPTITAILALQVIDAVATIGSMRTLGIGANQAAQGSAVPTKAADNTFTGTSNHFKHIVGTLGATISAGPGVGTGSATLLSKANDMAGLITFVVASGVANAIAGTVTFAQSYLVAPVVLLVPSSVNAIAQQATSRNWFVTASATNFTVNTGSTLPTNGAYIYAYHVLGVEQ